MLISTKVSFDLLKLSHPAVINAMQGDKNTRSIEAKLYSDGYPWADTSGLTAAVAFKKPDGTSGIYDRLPNGSSAVTVSKDTITAILAPQMLTAPGKVNAAILLSDASQQNQISTFPFHVHVEANPAAEAAASDDYYNYTSWEELSNAADAWFAEQDKKIAETLEGIRRVSAPSIVEPVRGEVITVSDASDLPLAGLKVFGRTEQNGIPTPDAPVPLESVGDSVTVTVCGKNLIPYPYPDSGKSFTIIKDNGDGSLTINGTTDKNIFFNLAIDVDFGDSYVSTYSSTTSGGRTFSISKTTVAGVYMGYQVNPNKGLFIKVEAGNTFDNVTIYPQIEYGNVSTDWESPNHQNILVSTSNGLPGIPVNSGGNYTDSSGQQWLCDEVDFEKGVYVQRVGITEIKGTENFESVGAVGDTVRWVHPLGNTTHGYVYDNTDGFYSHGLYVHRYSEDSVHGYAAGDYVYINAPKTLVGTTANDIRAYEVAQYAAGTPLTFVYPLLSEKEHHLSDEQKAAFAALHSNYPNTTVFNDAGAGMEVKYVADTKLYIDQKFNELAAALVSKV